MCGFLVYQLMWCESCVGVSSTVKLCVVVGSFNSLAACRSHECDY